MQDARAEIIDKLKEALKELGIEGVEPQLTTPSNPEHGDYSANIAMAIFASSKFSGKAGQNSKFRTPIELATHIKYQISNIKYIEKVEVAAPGFINFWLSKNYLVSNLKKMVSTPGVTTQSPKKIMVEYAHPNTHKEMHIGHMRTLITGEAIARLLESSGNEVFRANYQGDIGPHVAKALFGTQKLMEEENLKLDQIGRWSNKDKAHFLGKGYVRGNRDYEGNKKEIDGINRILYEKVSKGRSTPGESWLLLRQAQDQPATPGVPIFWNLYQITRQWSLDYYDEFYTRFYAKFDKLFFESEVSECGKKIVEENMNRVFVKDKDGSIVFPGEKYDLHTRVFVTSLGYPTYEGKEMCLAFKEFEAFPFDKIIHVVGSEQAGYFKVVFKALELLDREKFKDTQQHLSMGMVNIIGMKISSRTGEIMRVDDLVEKVKTKVNELIKEGKITSDDREKVAEQIAIGAIKYSVLKVRVGQNVEFDIEKLVSLDGNSGPYLQYTYARTRSVLAKSQNSNLKTQNYISKLKTEGLEMEELLLLRTLYRFPEAIEESANNMAPNVLTNYLFDLAQKFNLFYQRIPILTPQGRSTPGESWLLLRQAQDQPATPGVSSSRQFRLDLTEGVGIIIKNGLNLLGIEAPERM